jgi:hypothetical protein
VIRGYPRTSVAITVVFLGEGFLWLIKPFVG